MVKLRCLKKKKKEREREKERTKEKEIERDNLPPLLKEGVLEVVGCHPELDERPLPLRLHELHQMEQGHVVEQDIGHVHLQ